jgi:NitT/TauT family transport system substrate-binding protein
VSTGTAELAVSGLASAYQVAAQTPELVIIAVTPNNIYHLTAPTGSSIKSAADLRGKTVGVQSLSTSAYLYVRAAALSVGLDPDKDITWLPIGNGAQAAEAINSGQVDAYATYDGQLQVVSDLTKNKLEVVDTPLEDLNGSGAWVTNRTFLEENRDVVVSLMQGVAKAAQWTNEDPEAVIKHFWEVNPDAKPKDLPEEEALATTIAGASPIWRGLMGIGPDGTYGIPADADLEASIEFHQEGKLFEGELDEEAFDFSVMEEANQYDKAAVEEEARADG